MLASLPFCAALPYADPAQMWIVPGMLEYTRDPVVAVSVVDVFSSSWRVRSLVLLGIVGRAFKCDSTAKLQS